MAKIDDGGPVHPTMMKSGDCAISQGGMSLRDMFAAQFVAGAASGDCVPLDLDIAADQTDIDAALTDHWGAIARAAYIAADAMLAERARTIIGDPLTMEKFDELWSREPGDA